MSRIGYLEGTQTELLDRLAISGHQLLPLSDGWDGKGKNWAFLSEFDCLDMVVVHYYKLKSTSRLYYSSFSEVLNKSRACGTDVVIIAPSDLMEKVWAELKDFS